MLFSINRRLCFITKFVTLIIIFFYKVDAICPAGCTCFSSDHVVCTDIISNIHGIVVKTEYLDVTTNEDRRRNDPDVVLTEVEHVIHLWNLDVDTCTNTTCPTHSTCFDGSISTICRCDIGLVNNKGKNACVYGRKMFKVGGLKLKDPFVEEYGNTSSIVFIEKSHAIESAMGLLFVQYSNVIGSQVNKISKGFGHDTTTQRGDMLIDFIVITNDTLLKEADIQKIVQVSITRSNTSTLHVDVNNSVIVVRETDICKIRARACDGEREKCVYNSTLAQPFCRCKDGYEMDDIDNECEDESDDIEIKVVIPVCGIVVLLLCLGGYIYHKRSTSSGMNMSHSTNAPVTTSSFSNTAF